VMTILVSSSIVFPLVRVVSRNPLRDEAGSIRFRQRNPAASSQHSPAPQVARMVAELRWLRWRQRASSSTVGPS
jgi:hypothetical protein